MFLTKNSSLFLELACLAVSNPPSEHKWVRIGRGGIEDISVQNENEERVWVEERGKNSDISVVVIRNPQNHHLGTYICTATNTVGEAHEIIVLRGR